MKKLLLLSFLLLPLVGSTNGEVVSPNMDLPVPSVGITTGPAYATDIVDSLNLIDAHDHSPGKGVYITPSGLNINADLTFNGNDATTVRSVRFDAQGSPIAGAADLCGIYSAGVDLYYNDCNGNQIRLTQSGSIVGTSGSITGLSSPASASYVSGSSTFIWQSAVNTSANMDAGCYLMRNVTASSNAITICAPSSLASNYAITWPAALPASKKIATIDSSGNIGDNYDVDNSTLQITSNTLSIKNSGVGTTQIADGAVTQAKRAALGQQTSSNVASFSTQSATFVDATGVTVTITSTGRPIFVGLVSGATTPSTSTCTLNMSSDTTGEYAFDRDGTVVANYSFSNEIDTATTTPCTLYYIDVPAAGAHTYKLQMRRTVGTGSAEATITNVKMIAYEL